MKLKALFLFIVTSLLVACNAAAAGNANDQGPRAWIDMPLPGSQYTLEPIDILAHASAPTGVTALAFHVNGELVETIPTGDSTESLVTAQHRWLPAQPGTYTLAVAARDQSGNWSAQSEVSISVLQSLPEAPEFLSPDTPPDLPPTTVPPTTVPITAVPPTPTFTNPPPLPPTTQPPPPPPPDTENPVITQLLWNPVSPNEDEAVSFTVTATDNTSVARIEIYFVRQGETAQGPIKVCQSTGVCEHQASAGFPWGLYTYYAIAYDPAGNSVSSFTQTVQVLQVVK